MFLWSGNPIMSFRIMYMAAILKYIKDGCQNSIKNLERWISLLLVNLETQIKGLKVHFCGQGIQSCYLGSCLWQPYWIINDIALKLVLKYTLFHKWNKCKAWVITIIVRSVLRIHLVMEYKLINEPELAVRGYTSNSQNKIHWPTTGDHPQESLQ